MLELRGGNEGISQLAFSRCLFSGGSLDKRSPADLENKEVQDAVVHYLYACLANDVIPQPNCRTTG
eukprot:6273425-Pyramimonas_sp.AAC.1